VPAVGDSDDVPWPTDEPAWEEEPEWDVPGWGSPFAVDEPEWDEPPHRPAPSRAAPRSGSHPHRESGDYCAPTHESVAVLAAPDIDPEILAIANTTITIAARTAGVSITATDADTKVVAARLSRGRRIMGPAHEDRWTADMTTSLAFHLSRHRESANGIAAFIAVTDAYLERQAA
jgi:hypothetical protein